MTIDKLLPIANFPKFSGKYKVAQLLINDKPHLRFSERRTDDIDLDSIYFTNDIIKKTADILGKEVRLIDSNMINYNKILMVPDYSSDWYKLVGAGHAKIDVEDKKIKYFYGSSCIYRLGIDYEFIERIRPLVPDWKFPM